MPSLAHQQSRRHAPLIGFNRLYLCTRLQDKLYHMVLHLPVVLAAVSEAVQSILSSEFGRNPLLIPNGVDCERFFPGPRTTVSPSMILTAPQAKGQVCTSLANIVPRASTSPLKSCKKGSQTSDIGAACMLRASQRAEHIAKAAAASVVEQIVSAA